MCHVQWESEYNISKILYQESTHSVSCIYSRVWLFTAFICTLQLETCEGKFKLPT